MTDEPVITSAAVDRRRYWTSEIVKISGEFGPDVERAAQEMADEESRDGPSVILDHLRLCGAIPESYGHDSSEEKLYSKYTDAVIAAAFSRIGCRSAVLTERADAADVECFTPDFSFVADAKAFRLSRTAKNQKDFKVQAMDGWRRDKNYAVVVSPLYQYPNTSSQIYEQAATRDVCLLSYSHLAVIVGLALVDGPEKATELLRRVVACVSLLHPSKSATSYWQAINGELLSGPPRVSDLWRTEKLANVEAIAIAKEEGLTHLSLLRTEVMNLSHEQALVRLLQAHKIEGRERTIRAVVDNELMSL